MSINGDDKPSHDLQWLATILAGFEPSLMSLTYTDEAVLQLLAQLRSCFALSFHHLQPSEFLDGLRTQSRCYVYDLRNYGHENNWGPFLCGGQVNWIHVESIIIVVLRNLVPVPHPLTPPLGLHAARMYSAPGSLACKQTDWAGIEGTWARYVCFVDYRSVSFCSTTTTNSQPCYIRLLHGKSPSVEYVNPTNIIPTVQNLMLISFT